MPESLLQYQVERTPEGHFVKGQSGNAAGSAPGVPEPREAQPPRRCSTAKSSD
jgi:hypothetical protein